MPAGRAGKGAETIRRDWRGKAVRHEASVSMRCFAAGAAALVISASAAAQEQRSFPTGNPGSVVNYLDAGGAVHPTGCVVSITAGLPALAISINVFE